MECKKCKSNNVLVTSEQVNSKTKKKKMGIIWRFCRLTMICCTGGLWLVFGKKSGTERTKFKHRTVAICQECGHKQKV